jgi:hypothetical protein
LYPVLLIGPGLHGWQGQADDGRQNGKNPHASPREV